MLDETDPITGQQVSYEEGWKNFRLRAKEALAQGLSYDEYCSNEVRRIFNEKKSNKKSPQ